MPAVAAMIYLLLALRVRISLEGTICGAGGSLSLIAGAAGMYIRFDGEITRKKDAYTLLLVPRYRKGRMQKKMKRTRSKPMNIVRTYLWFARAGKIEWLTADVRIGLGAAGETAAAAGILQALAYAFAVAGIAFKISFGPVRMLAYYVMTVFAQIVGVRNILTGRAKPFWEVVESTR